MSPCAVATASTAGALGAVAFDPEPAHLVGTGGALGAVLRHWVYLQFSSERFPWPTLAVNVLGSFVFGLLTFLGATASTLQLVGIGICGAFTTFSSFSVETVQLYERGDRLVAVANAAGNLALSLAAIGFAWALVSTGVF
ncbi:fluoride efflux transporter FluC [Natronolimnohabitans innermongolicus]|uniref:Fluoride-specific ion channel FluC n=1 Tax=Natronolimnohabitans innermongolicus JCM 12255 TaxID=1227499 RepID=L9X4M6_9EURY|nr:CrcB family protein [Natronolimnohabitans innermongolicus]ELY56660.1 CrcB protein [Natronolimnohabitans innermongolicus JCM 12255]